MGVLLFLFHTKKLGSLNQQAERQVFLRPKT